MNDRIVGPWRLKCRQCRWKNGNEDEELEFDRECAQTEYPTQHLDTCSEVQNMIATEIEKLTFHRNMALLTRMLDDSSIKVL